MTTAQVCRSALLLAGTVLGMALCGCDGRGSSKADVTGTIKLGGQQPKTSGLQIGFQASDGTLVTAPIAEDGTYRAEGVPVGEVKIYFIFISPAAAAEGAQPRTGRLQKPKGDSMPRSTGTREPGRNPVRENLRDASTSNLKMTVEAGKANTFDYDLPP